MGDTLFTTSLAGEEILRLQTWGTGDLRCGDYLKGSPCTMLDLPQPLMEPILLDAAASRGAILSFNTEYLDHTQDEDGVTVRFRDGRTGRSSPSAPATFSASTAPAHASSSSSACPWRASWRALAPPTSGSGPT